MNRPIIQGIAIIIAAIKSQAYAAQAPDYQGWFQKRANQEYCAYVDVELPETLRVSWKTLGLGTSPIVSDGKIFQSISNPEGYGNGYLAGFNADDGSKIVEKQQVVNIGSAQTMIDDGFVYVTSDSGSSTQNYINAYNSDTLSMDHRYYIHYFNEIYAFGSELGMACGNYLASISLWSYPNSPCTALRIVEADDWIPIYGELQAFMGPWPYKGHFVSLNNQAYSVVGNNSLFYCNTSGNTIFKIYETTGNQESAFSVINKVITEVSYSASFPIAADNQTSKIICIPDDGSRVDLRNSTDGKRIYSNASVGIVDRDSIAVGNGRLVALSKQNKLLTILSQTDLTIVKQVSIDISGDITTGVTMARNAILFGDSLGNVHIYDPETLEPKQEKIHVADAMIVGEIAIAGDPNQGDAFVSAADETLARLGLEGPECAAISTGYAQNGHQGRGPGGVNTLSGNFAFTVQDLSIPFAGLSINLLRTYNSQLAKPVGTFSRDGTILGAENEVGGTPFISCLGPGWRHSYEVGVRPQYDEATGGTLYVEARSDGRNIGYTYSISGEVENPDGIEDEFSFIDVKSVLGGPDTEKGVRLRKKSGLVRDFDSEGHLIRIRDPSDNELVFSYTPTSTIKPNTPGASLIAIAYFPSTSIEDPYAIPEDKSTTVYLDYDDEVRLVKVRYPDPSGTAEVDILYTYDLIGRLTNVTGPGGIYKASYEYDLEDRMIVKREPRAPPGEKWLSYQYDGEGRVFSVYSGESYTHLLATYGYGQMFMEKMESTIYRPGGVITTHVYDKCRILTEIRDAVGNVTQYEWDEDLNQTRVTDANQNSTAYTYDPKGNVLTITDALEGVAEFEYEPIFNHVTKKIDANDNETTYEYDDAGNLIKETKHVKGIFNESATEFITLHSYEGRGLRISTTAANGSDIYYQYDGVGNLTATVRRLVKSDETTTEYMTRYEYDAQGRRIAQISPNGTRTEYEYDLGNRLVEIRYGIAPNAGPLTSMTLQYDARGRVIKQTDASGRFTSFTYDERDLVATAADALGNTTTHTYDERGNRISTQDANGNATHFSYNVLDRLVAVTDAENGIAKYEYDAVGNLIRQTDPNNNLTSNAYDELNRLVLTVHPDPDNENTETYEYDAVGNIVRAKDGRNYYSNYTWDSLNRVRQVEYVGGDPPIIRYYYDQIGNRIMATTSIEGQDYITSYKYDSLNRLSEEKVGVSGNELATKIFLYDNVGNRIKLVVDASNTDEVDHAIEYEYDSVNRLIGIINNGRTTEYEYDASGNPIIKRLPNRIQAKYEYDMANRLLSIVNSREASPLGAALSYFEYEYDAVGNRINMRTMAGLHQYEYDRLYRITSVDYPARPDQTYTYDDAGNRMTLALDEGTQKEYQYNSLNQLIDIQIGETKYKYEWDMAGNLKKKTKLVDPNSEATEYGFDAANRMTSVMLSDGKAVTYGYDADGQRVYEEVDGNVTWYVYDALSVLMELNHEKLPRAAIVPGVSKTGLDSLEPLTEYYLYDGLGSVVQLTDALGNPTQEYDYDVFGKVENIGSDPHNRYRFVGLAHDNTIGLTYMNARWYDPEIGRFCNLDPLPGRMANNQDRNRYLYVGNNPMNYTDIRGLGLWDYLKGLLKSKESAADSSENNDDPSSNKSENAMDLPESQNITPNSPNADDINNQPTQKPMEVNGDRQNKEAVDELVECEGYWTKVGEDRYFSGARCTCYWDCIPCNQAILRPPDLQHGGGSSWVGYSKRIYKGTGNVGGTGGAGDCHCNEPPPASGCEETD